MKNLKIVEKAPTSVVMGLCFQKTMNTKVNEKFFNNQKHSHPTSFAEIEKTKIEGRIKNESETSTLAPRDISDF